MTYNASMHVMIGRLLALVLLCIVAPIFGLIGLIILVDSGWPIFFGQKRMGKDKKPFWIWKFRTMVKNANQLQARYSKLNEADGPVFKIRHDPRYTRFGKWLSWSGLDELPQLINVIKGEMALVGPRPLPLAEALKVPHRYAGRFTVLPGMTSSWVTSGAHALSFKEWMELDLRYLEKKSLYYDLSVIVKTLVVITKAAISEWHRSLMVAVVILGGILRYLRITTEVVWNDEAFYLSVARANSLIDLLLTNHWIIDHPPLYLIFVHFWSAVSTAATWLRIPNLVFYLISSMTLIKISSQVFVSKLLSVIMVASFSFFPYFVGMDWQAIPYSMTMMFFLLCLKAYLRIPKDKSGGREWRTAAISLALFFYTSFEAVYFAGTIFLYNLIKLPSYSRTERLSYIKMYGLALVLVLPELIVVVKQFPSFASLSGHWQEWKWGATSLLRDVFSVKDNLGLFLAVTLIPMIIAITSIAKSETVYRKNVWLFLGMLFGFGGFLSLVSYFFFYASHPKAYYYFLIVLFLLFLTCFEWGMQRRRKLTLLYIFVFMQSSIWWFYPGRSFVLADYQYSNDMPEPTMIRKSLTQLLESVPEAKLLTDMEKRKGKWVESYYLNYYYLSCLDLDDVSACEVIRGARVTQERGELSSSLVGIFYDDLARAEFVMSTCVQAQECYLWDFVKKEFVKVK